ncbi:MAG: FAD-dependent oxidoreductase [Desulfobacteraceae bacterium]|nr:FAD-dependent oxidoreductase [Desulfobacteraceae bacterium]MBC2755802.1 FAD-dependent oxidoreductase [Desulfobacteraceae bacterium]
MRLNLLESLSDNIAIDKDKCVFCSICVNTCILDNLRMKLAPCRQGCPLGVNCQGYVQLIARGEEKQAMEILRKDLPFPAILGRVCSHPCEETCHRKETEGDAVAIRNLKRYLADQFADEAIPLPEMQPDSGKTIAIVGSGPAGMMAAYDLRIQGHLVTIFDSEKEPGGMLRWAIPDFRLPQSVLDKEMGLLADMGVSFQCNVAIGKDKTIEALKNEFDAVVVATGCPEHGLLHIAGEEKQGVYHGLPFLKIVHEGKSPEIGEKVIVIGGGNVAVDSAQTALRLGAKEVTMATLESDKQLPAFPEAIESAAAEGIKFECSWGNPKLNFQDDRLIGIDFQRCVQVFDDCGCFAPSFDDCELHYLDADTVIIAIGQQVDKAFLESAGLIQDDKMAVDPLTLQAPNTPDEKVFVAGDTHKGPSSVIHALASGREAAESVHRFLCGEHLRFGRAYPGPIETEFDIDTSGASLDKRIIVTEHHAKGKGDFQEIESSITQEAARLEAKRCYSCGQPFGKFRTCWFCLPCEVECPNDALKVKIPYLLR